MRYILCCRLRHVSLKRFNGLKVQHTSNRRKCVIHLATQNQLCPTAHSWSHLHGNSSRAMTLWNHVPLCSPTFILDKWKMRDRKQQFRVLNAELMHEKRLVFSEERSPYNTERLKIKQKEVILCWNGREIPRYPSNCFHLLSQRKLSRRRLRTASSERPMHILSRKKGQCMHYTASICFSCTMSALCSGHSVHSTISLRARTQQLWLHFQSKLSSPQHLFALFLRENGAAKGKQQLQRRTEGVTEHFKQHLKPKHH